MTTFVSDRDFLEVETPILSADVVVDRHLDPLSTILFDDARQPDRGRRILLRQHRPQALLSFGLADRTAHVRIDYDSGTMYLYGYEAGGLALVIFTRLGSTEGKFAPFALFLGASALPGRFRSSCSSTLPGRFTGTI